MHEEEERMPLRGTAQERAPLAPPGDGDGAAPNGGASAACSPCPWSSSSTSYFVVFACSVAILLGYDIGVMSGAALAIEQSLQAISERWAEIDNGAS